MKIIFVRHGEPDYVNDSLTEKGWREARLLAERISRWRVTEFYCSPLGRARDTASCTLEKTNRTAITLDWMKEFYYPIDDPITGRHGVPWDLIPSYWTKDPLLMDMDRWVEADLTAKNPEIAQNYKIVWKNLDQLLASYGYVREGLFYRMPDATEKFVVQTAVEGEDEYPEVYSQIYAEDEKEPVIVIFCHLGITCLALSHLLNIPFELLTHGFFIPTTSLTIVSSEQRWSNEAYFRVQRLGDVAHLASGGETISTAGSFAKPFEG